MKFKIILISGVLLCILNYNIALSEDFLAPPTAPTPPAKVVKKDLEIDGGYATQQEQNNLNAPRVIDRGNNKGLIDSLKNALASGSDGKKAEPSSSKNVKSIKMKDTFTSNAPDLQPPSINDADEKINGKIESEKTDGIFANIVNKVKDFFTLSDDTGVRQAKPLRKKSLADLYPDPRFKKADITDTKYSIPLVLLNDKTNPENSHIPSFDNHEDLKILFLMFKNIKNLDRIDSLKAMLDYIKNNKLIDTQDQYGNTMLNYATRYNNIQAFYLLIDAGANPNLCNASGICPIHTAISNFQHSIFNILLQTHTKYDLMDRKGFDPLLYSIHYGNLYAFKILINLEPYKSKLGCSDMKYLRGIAKEGENVKIVGFIKDVITKQKCDSEQELLNTSSNNLSLSIFDKIVN